MPQHQATRSEAFLCRLGVAQLSVSIFARQICCWVSGLLSRYPEARQQLCRVISAAAQAAEDANQLHDEEFISLKQRSHGVCVWECAGTWERQAGKKRWTKSSAIDICAKFYSALYRKCPQQKLANAKKDTTIEMEGIELSFCAWGSLRYRAWREQMWAFCNVLAGFAYRSCSAPSSLMAADSRYVIHFRFGTDQKSEGKEPVFSREHCGSYFSFSFQSCFVLHVFGFKVLHGIGIRPWCYGAQRRFQLPGAGPTKLHPAGSQAQQGWVLLPKIGGTPWIGAGVGVPIMVGALYNSRNGNWIFIDLNLCDWCGDVARGCSAPAQASSYPPAVAALRKKSKFDVESLCTLRPEPETCSSIGHWASHPWSPNGQEIIGSECRFGTWSHTWHGYQLRGYERWTSLSS